METESLDHNESTGLKVVKISKERASSLNANSQIGTVPWGTYAHIDKNKGLKTLFASSCVIPITFVIPTQEIILGHFTNTKSSHLKNILKRTLNFPPQYKLGTTEASMQNYHRFLREIKELREKYGAKSLKTYLFGQNFYLPPNESPAWSNAGRDEIMEISINRYSIVADLLASSLSLSDIKDFRSEDPKEINSNDSIYILPDSNQVLWYQQKI